MPVQDSLQKFIIAASSIGLSIYGKDDRYPVDTATRETTLEELDMDSLDQVELVMALEEQFDMEISDDEAESMYANCKTVGDLISQIELKVVAAGKDPSKGVLSYSDRSTLTMTINHLETAIRAATGLMAHPIISSDTHARLTQLCKASEDALADIRSDVQSKTGVSL